MIVEKRTMNWLPRASVYSEMEAAREKRRAALQEDLAVSASYNSTLISTNTTYATGDSINLTLSVAAKRIQDGTTAKVGIA